MGNDMGMRLLLVVSCVVLSGCATLFPASLSVKERLAMFPQDDIPVRGEVTLRWNEFQVPVIEAQYDEDVPLMLGLVHAHLRWGQVAFFKRVARGRMSEIAGPWVNDIDHVVRMLGISSDNERLWRAMSDEARVWISRFVRGFNYYQQHMIANHSLPPSFSLLGIEPEPLTHLDVVTLMRLSGSDISWFSLLSVLMGENHQQAEAFWRQLIESYSNGASLSDLQAAREEQSLSLLSGLFSSYGRVGSNSFAVAPKRSSSGGALLVNDPHLGSSSPNFWVMASIHSPSYDVVGFMMAGVPVMAMGRNRHVAWGGTHMRGMMSDLFDVSDLVARQQFSETTTTIKTRWWFDEEVTLRETDYGMIITDSPLFHKPAGKDVALRWVGQGESDEMTAFLRMMRATNHTEFEQAFATYAVPSINFIYATKDGVIGKLYGGRFPDRDEERMYQFPKSIQEDDWRAFHTALSLPIARNPKRGFLVSGNDAPDNLGDERIGYFFSSKDRVERMAHLIAAKEKLNLADVRRILLDVKSERALYLASVIQNQLQRWDITDELLAAWDGRYDVNSQGAVRFELMLYYLAHALYGDEDGDIPRWQARWTALSSSLEEDINALPMEEHKRIVTQAWQQANEKQQELPRWGDMHRMKEGYILKAVPVLGSFFDDGDWGIAGSRSTLFKSSHRLVDDKHYTSYGSQSRLVSDMSDDDANYAILIGGQDGWLGSASFNDQTPLWREGQFIQLPLTAEKRQQLFPNVMRFAP